MAFSIFSDKDYSSSGLPADTGMQAGGAGVAGGSVRGSGHMWYQAPAAGGPPATTAGDIVVATATIPAGAFDAAGRSLAILANGSFAANGNTKTVKLIIAPTTAVIGSPVTGGTTIANTGAVTTSGGGWTVGAEVVKVGAAGANTQTVINTKNQCGATVVALSAPAALTLTESGAIVVALTVNCATTATDALLWKFAGRWSN